MGGGIGQLGDQTGICLSGQGFLGFEGWALIWVVGYREEWKSAREIISLALFFGLGRVSCIRRLWWVLGYQASWVTL